MTQPTAIVAAAFVAVAGYVLTHALARRMERKRAEEAAVADLVGAAMVLAQLRGFKDSLGSGPAWRQLLFGDGPRLPADFAFQLADRGLRALDEVVRAHGSLLQHARADLADAAGDLLDACEAVAESWGDPDPDVVQGAHRTLGQMRLRLLQVSRGRRSARWRLGRPVVFDNIGPGK